MITNLTRVLRRTLALASALLLLVLAPPSWAADGEAPKLMVRPFSGPKKDALYERVWQVLQDQGADLVPAGFEGPRAMETDADYAAVAKEHGIQAYILGEATNDNTGWTLELSVRQGTDGTVAGSSVFKASWFPGLLTKIDEELIPTLEKVLSGKAPEGAPEASPAADQAPADAVADEGEAEEEEGAEKPRPKPLELDAGAGFVFRNYVANNPVNLPGVLQTRDQSGGMANLRIGAAVYPAALFTGDFLANLGLVGHFERSLGGKTQAQDDPTGNLPSGDLDTTLQSYDLGVRVRLPISDHELGFTAAYGAHQFEIDDGGTDSDPTNPDTEAKLVPDVDYAFIRLGADFTYSLNDYFLNGDVGFRVIDNAGKDPGQIQNDRWFPRSDVRGVDFGVNAGYRVTERFTVTVGMDFRNFFYTMNSELSDFGLEDDVRRPVAGGANDMYFAGVVAARYSLR